MRLSERSLSRDIDRDVGFGFSYGKEFDEKKDPRYVAAEETVEYFEYYSSALKDQFDKAVKWWKMWMLISNGSYKPWEYWRNRVISAYPNTTIETSAAHIVTQILAQDPPVVPESFIGTGREKMEKRIRQWFAYAFRKNSFNREMELFIREMLIQSMSVRKNVLIQKVREILHFPSDAEAAAFDEGLTEVVTKMGVKPPEPEDYETQDEFKEVFETFRQSVNAQGARLPELPSGGLKRVAHYIGPGWKRISMFSFFYDPSQPIYDNDGYILENVVSKDWVRSRAGEHHDLPFDGALVDEILQGGASQRLGAGNTESMDSQGRNTWEAKLAGSLSASSVAQMTSRNPGLKESCHILEHYKPGDKIPYRVVLNGIACINKRKSNPFIHGDTPFTIATNVNVPFNSSGISDLAPAESLFNEANTLRSLILDGVKLSVLPVFSRIKESGLTDLAKFIIPGIILDAPRTRGAIEQVSKIEPPLQAYRQMSDLRSEIEDATSTYPNARGGVGPQGITATQSERAFQGLTLRNQIKILRIESDMNNLPSQWLSIAKQFLTEEDLGELNKSLIEDITGSYSINDFSQAIELDWVFKASRLASNKDMLLTQLKDAFTMGANAFASSPEKPASMERLYMAIIRKIDPDIAAEIETTAEEQVQQQQQAAAAMQQAEQQAAQGQEPQQEQQQ